MEWLIANKEWVFSGVGIFIAGCVYTLFKKPEEKKVKKMKQKSGANSTNIQIGGDYNAGK